LPHVLSAKQLFLHFYFHRMDIIIRQEQPKDHATVFQIVETAFKTMKYSSHTEQFIVEKLRKSDAFISELSLVAELEGQLVGYIILSKIHIDSSNHLIDALSLGPVAVLPEFQKQGIGGQLIKKAHKIAKSLGHEIIILLGHKDYYPRFGYELTSKYGIQLPFDSAPENCMVLGLNTNSLKGVSGKVVYSKPFLE